jgi:hypothetical protein
MGSAHHAHYERWVAALAPGERDSLLTGLTALVRVMRAEPVSWGPQHLPPVEPPS